MEPANTDGVYVLFRAPGIGSRQGKTVLVLLRDEADPETRERYTVKRFTIAKARNGDAWQHLCITLKLANPDFQSIVVTGAAGGQLRAIAEVF